MGIPFAFGEIGVSIDFAEIDCLRTIIHERGCGGVQRGKGEEVEKSR
jgi:hypothetical protein